MFQQSNFIFEDGPASIFFTIYLLDSMPIKVSVGNVS